MDGKIIQEVEGIVNSSGFVRMSKIVSTSARVTQTIYTDFVPKIILYGTTSDGGINLRGCEDVKDTSSTTVLYNVSWTNSSVTFTPAYDNRKVVVLG